MTTTLHQTPKLDTDGPPRTATTVPAAVPATTPQVMPAPAARPALAGRSLRALRAAVGGVLLVALLAALGALVVVPRVAGWVPLTVLSGSMEPTIPTGSQVIIDPVRGEEEAARLQVGDIITVMPYPENPTLVTHRIVSRTDSSAGVSFVTQGDANSIVDDWEVTATQIRGEVKYWVPGAGYVATALDGQQKSIAIIAVAGALLVYSITQVVGGLRDRRRAGDE